MDAAEEFFQRIKRELCEAPVLGMSTEKGKYVLGRAASVVAISGILHREEKWNGSTVLADLGNEPFKLRVDNRALSWVNTYSLDQSFVGRWIVCLDGYIMITEHRTRDQH